MPRDVDQVARVGKSPPPLRYSLDRVDHLKVGVPHAVAQVADFRLHCVHGIQGEDVGARDACDKNVVPDTSLARSIIVGAE